MRTIRLPRDPIVLGVAVLTLVTLALRFSQIHQSLFGDETWTYGDILGKSFGSVLTNVHTGGENSPPFFFLLAWATGKIGDLSVWIRLPSIILSTLTVPLLFLIGRETVGRVSGLLAAAILTVSPFSFYYGVEARPYATMAFFVALSTLCLLRAVRTGKFGWWALYTASSVAAAYTHYTSVFVLLAQGLWSLWVCRDRIRAPLIASATAALLYLPWVPHLRGKSLGIIGVLEPLNAHNVLTDLARPIAGYPYAPPSSIPTVPGLVLIGGCALLGLACVVYREFILKSQTIAQPNHFWLLVVLALATPVGMFVYSELFTDIWLARGLYASVPAAALVLAALATGIPRPWNGAAVAIIGAVLIFATIEAALPKWQRPPTREIASYLDANASPRNPIAFVTVFGQAAVMDQIRKAHRVVAAKRMAQSTPAGANAYLVVEDDFAKDFGTRPVPAPPSGMRLVGDRHYSSHVDPFDVVIYRKE